MSNPSAIQTSQYASGSVCEYPYEAVMCMPEETETEYAECLDSFVMSPPPAAAHYNKGGARFAPRGLPPLRISEMNIGTNVAQGTIFSGPVSLGIAILLGLLRCHSVPDVGSMVEEDDGGVYFDDTHDMGRSDARAQNAKTEECAGFVGSSEIACNDADEDCDGVTFQGTDGDSDNYKLEGGLCGEVDCDDTRGDVYPGATEILDGADNDCDGIIDRDSWLQVSAGMDHTCGMRTDNTVECWGGNVPGQPVPTLPPGTYNQVDAGYQHTCGIRTDNTVVCDGTGAGYEFPPSGPFNQIDIGAFACGIRTDDTITCWAVQDLPSPSGTFNQVSAGLFWNACGIHTDGTVECWGNNLYGQSASPSGTFNQVSAGWIHTCAIRTDDTITCWPNSDEFTLPSGTFSQVSTGSGHACGIRTDDTVECWGDNSYGQSAWPAGTFKQVSAGGLHTCGIRTDDTIECWGYNDRGQATPPTP